MSEETVDSIEDVAEVEEGEEVAEAAQRAGFVAIVGQPNVGKSTLLNQILGVKVAIATHRPQTTRNRILGVKTLPGRGQVAFIDTPGIHTSKKRLNRAIVRFATESLEDVDAVLHLVDAQDLTKHVESGSAEALPPAEQHVKNELAGVDIPRVLVVNKLDLVRPSHRLLPVIERLTGGVGVQTLEDDQLPGSSTETEAFYSEVVPVSARSGDNVDTLLDVLLGLLPESHPLFPEDMLTDQAERFLAAEFVREQLMIQTAKEIPYSVAVEVERFIDDPRGKVIEISAVIHVERDSQKGIVIGKRGARLKEIGQRARQQMEEFFGKRVFLETFVRVQEDWSEDPRSLQRFGYE